MKRGVIYLVAVVAAATLVIVGCTQTAPAPTPTSAPPAPAQAAPTAAPVPTKAPAAPTKAPAAPTAAPAAKVDFPAKGKAITLIIPFPTGGASDTIGRLLAPALEKDLGVPVQVVNKSGAGGQLGYTELSTSNPDGYTIGFTNLPAIVGIALDPDRKAVFTRKSFQPVAQLLADPIVMAVKEDSKYKNMKDLVDDAKANPEKVKVAAAGIMSSQHMTGLLLMKAADAKLAIVHFQGGGEHAPALLGGHVDAALNTLSEMMPHVKSGKVRILGVADSDENPFLPGIKTMDAQGYKVNMAAMQCISAPAGTPKEVVAVLTGAIKKALDGQEMKDRMSTLGLAPRYADPEKVAASWAGQDADIEPLIKLAKQ